MLLTISVSSKKIWGTTKRKEYIFQYSKDKKYYYVMHQDWKGNPIYCSRHQRQKSTSHVSDEWVIIQDVILQTLLICHCPIQLNPWFKGCQFKPKLLKTCFFRLPFTFHVSLFTLHCFTRSSSIRFRSAFDDGAKPSACRHTNGLSMHR